MIVAMTPFIAYVSGNIVSDYLLINYIPGTGELLFYGALIGAALGFLWFNATSKVFMVILAL